MMPRELLPVAVPYRAEEAPVVAVTCLLHAMPRHSGRHSMKASRGCQAGLPRGAQARIDRYAGACQGIRVRQFDLIDASVRPASTAAHRGTGEALDVKDARRRHGDTLNTVERSANEGDDRDDR